MPEQTQKSVGLLLFTYKNKKVQLHSQNDIFFFTLGRLNTESNKGPAGRPKSLRQLTEPEFITLKSIKI